MWENSVNVPNVLFVMFLFDHKNNQKWKDILKSEDIILWPAEDYVETLY